MIVLGLKKTIGKMGSLAKQGASRASEAVKAEYHQAKEHYPENKRRIKKAVAKADKWGGKSLNYATRVRDNANKSIFLGASPEKPVHHKKVNRKRGGQTVIIYVNSSGRRKKRKQHNNSGFSLI